MANFLALIGDTQKEEPLFGILLFHSLVQGRYHWYLLGIDNMPLVRGIVECDDDPFGADVCIDALKEEIAAKIGLTPEQIRLLDGRTVDASSFVDAAVSSA